MAEPEAPNCPPPPPPPRDCMTSQPVNVSYDIQLLPYYYPNLKNMNQVKELLSRHTNRDGSFILRNSISKPGQYTISVIHMGGIKHFNIEISPQNTFFLKDVQFRTMQQLIQHYALNEVPNREQIRQVHLLYPITRASSDLRTPSGSVSGTDGIYIDTISREAAIMQQPVAVLSAAATTGAGAGAGLRRASSTVEQSSNRTNGGLHHIENRRASSINYYSQLSDDSQSKATELIRSMTLHDEPVVCDCGLLTEESILPRGWSVHISTDPETAGEIYFMAPDLSTRWVLPLEVSLELTADQQDRIRDLIHDFERKFNRAARAKTSTNQQTANVPVVTATMTSCSNPVNSTEGDYIGPMQVLVPSPASHSDLKGDMNYMPMNGNGFRPDRK